MTQALEYTREQVLQRSLRPVAKEIGVSHDTLRMYLTDPSETSDRTQELVRRWYAAQVGGVSTVGPAELPAPELPNWLQIEAEAARVRAEAMLQEALAAVERAHAARLAEQGALTRTQAIVPGATVEADRALITGLPPDGTAAGSEGGKQAS